MGGFDIVVFGDELMFELGNVYVCFQLLSLVILWMLTGLEAAPLFR
jgi:hypothetical protein